jgi:hypothetical protein
MNFLTSLPQYIGETFESSQIKYLKSLVESGETFMVSDKQRIEKYIDLFDILETHDQLYNYLFKIEKVLPINSANGMVFLIRLKEMYAKDVNNAVVLVKVPLEDADADSLSYEYYIGKSLNNLRKDNLIPSFSLLYGKIMCGFGITDNFSDLQNVKICDPEHDKKIHLVYEYIRNVNTKRTTSLGSYLDTLKYVETPDDAIKIERNLINILIIILYSLQVAYDTMQFTHYDLHLGNILIVELDTPEKVVINYKDEQMTIVTNVMPYIIDYGRCYIKNDKSIPDEDGKYRDIYSDYQEVYDSLSEFQESLFDADMYIESNSRKTNIVDNQIACYVQKYVHKKLLFKESSTERLYYYEGNTRIYDIYSDTPTTKGIKKLIIDNVFNRHTINTTRSNWRNETDNTGKSSIRTNRYNLGIKSNKPNSKYDFYKLVRTVINNILTYQPDNIRYQDEWAELESQLDTEYPFYDSNYFSLPCDYHITDYMQTGVEKGVWGHWIKSASDVGKILFSWIKDDIYITENAHIRHIQHTGGAVFMDTRDILRGKIEKNLVSKKGKASDYKDKISAYKDQSEMIDSITITPSRTFTPQQLQEKKLRQSSIDDDFKETTDFGPRYIIPVETEISKAIKKKHALYGKPHVIHYSDVKTGPVKKSYDKV